MYYEMDFTSIEKYKKLNNKYSITGQYITFLNLFNLVHSHKVRSGVKKKTPYLKLKIFK